MKQTAVEWFEAQVGHNSIMGLKEFNDIFEQAKEMEKEQMRTASCPYVGGWEEDEFEYWYNEKYNNNESKTNI
jgi:hypothetical protein